MDDIGFDSFHAILPDLMAMDKLGAAEVAFMDTTPRREHTDIPATAFRPQGKEAVIGVEVVLGILQHREVVGGEEIKVLDHGIMRNEALGT